MYRNILIISNDTCQYHFTVNREICFELVFNSESELSIATNSPEMAVLKSIAFSMHNAKDQLAKVCEGKALQQLCEKLYILPIHSIETTYHYENTASVHIAGHKPDKSIENEYYDLKMKNGEWMITNYRIE